MSNSSKTIEVKVERTIPASLEMVFDGWLNPKTPGTPWNESGKLIFDPKVDGLFYWSFKPTGTPHFGRFTELERPNRIQHTWMSPNTSGIESNVTVTFKKKGSSTLMTITHSGLPDTEGGRSHERGWSFFLSKFPDQFGDKK